jgi:hypothetical protein
MLPLNMTPNLRKLLLTAHVASSVGLLGAVAAFLTLAIAGLTDQDERIVRGAYPAMELIAQFAIVPLAFASLLTGIVQSLGTQWGLFRHYWVIAKFSITAFATVVLLAKMELISHAARLAEEAALSRSDLRSAGLQLLVHATGGLLILLIPTALSVYKPRGVTAYGKRKSREAQQPAVPRVPEAEVSPRRPGWTIHVPNLAYVFGFAIVVIAAHVLVAHLLGGGLGHH